jgi:hypothetical protein
VADTLKVLGQSAPSATTETDLYTVPGGTSATVSTVIVCNRAGSAATFRITVAPAGAATTNAQYLYYDLPIPANDSFALTLGVTLAATDKIRVYASSANLTFQAFGVEVT